MRSEQSKTSDEAKQAGGSIHWVLPPACCLVDASHGRIHSQIVNLFDFGVIAEALHIAVSPEVLEVQHQLAVQAIVLVEHPVFLHELADLFQHFLCFRVVFRYLNGNLFDALVGEADHVVLEFLQKCYPLLHSFSFCVCHASFCKMA